MAEVDITAIPILELRALLQDITDTRKPRGKRYKLPSLIALIVLGTLGGLPRIAHIAQWAKKLPRELLKELGFRAGQVPSHTTLHRITYSVDVDEFTKIAREFCKKHKSALVEKRIYG